MNKLFLILNLLFCMATISAQTSVSGTVLDRDTHAKMKSVSITIPNTNISTVTNDDGFFMLKLQNRPERITASSLGYKKQTVNIAEGKTEGLRIYMTPAAIALPDLKVWQNDPEALIMAAIEHVTDNFVQTRELHTSFYRETLQKGSRYIDISEAILTTCKQGYDKGIDFDRVKVEHGRHIVSQRAKDTISVKVLGGPRTAINFDVVKNEELLFFDMKQGCYEYTMEMPEELDGRTQIVISFRPKTVREWVLYNGKIYLDRQSLAFTRIEMSMDMSDLNKVTKLLLVKKPFGLRFKPQELTAMINYRDGRINYMRTSFRFKCDWKKRLFSHGYTTCSEMVVTDFTTDYKGPNIESKERFSDRDALTTITKTINKTDSDFWKDYNIIEPTESLEKAINKLKKR